MSGKEAQRLAVVSKVLDGQMAQAQAAVALALSVRQIKRLVRQVRAHGGLSGFLCVRRLVNLV